MADFSRLSGYTSNIGSTAATAATARNCVIDNMTTLSTISDCQTTIHKIAPTYDGQIGITNDGNVFVGVSNGWTQITQWKDDFESYASESYASDIAERNNDNLVKCNYIYWGCLNRRKRNLIKVKE